MYGRTNVRTYVIMSGTTIEEKLRGRKKEKEKRELKRNMKREVNRQKKKNKTENMKKIIFQKIKKVNKKIVIL